MQIEDLIWEQARTLLFMPKEQYLEQLRAFDIEAVERDGVLIGAVMRKGPEFHFATFGVATRIGRPLMRELLAPQLDRYGYVETRTPHVDARQHRFNRLVGFQPIGEDEYGVHYRLERDRSALHRRTACPQPH